MLRLRCVTALVALFEGRSDFTVHARVVSQLDVGVLKRVMADVYTEYRDTCVNVHMHLSYARAGIHVNHIHVGTSWG